MEKQNNIILAPITAQVTELYNEWKETNVGTLEDFYKFMVTPSVKRELFLSSLKIESQFNGSFIANIFQK